MKTYTIPQTSIDDFTQYQRIKDQAQIRRAPFEQIRYAQDRLSAATKLYRNGTIEEKEYVQEQLYFRSVADMFKQG